MESDFIDLFLREVQANRAIAREFDKNLAYLNDFSNFIDQLAYQGKMLSANQKSELKKWYKQNYNIIKTNINNSSNVAPIFNQREFEKTLEDKKKIINQRIRNIMIDLEEEGYASEITAKLYEELAVLRTDLKGLDPIEEKKDIKKSINTLLD